MDGGGVATCRELVLDYVSDVTWRVNAEIGNDYKKVSISAQQDILDTIQVNIVALVGSWQESLVGTPVSYYCCTSNCFHTVSSHGVHGCCMDIVRDRVSSTMQLLIGRLRFQGNAACSVTRHKYTRLIPPPELVKCTKAGLPGKQCLTALIWMSCVCSRWCLHMLLMKTWTV